MKRCDYDKALNKWGFSPDWKEHVIHDARTLLVASVGLATGLFAARHMSLRGEFMADRRAVEMTGNPQLFKEVLSEVHDAFKEGRKLQPSADSLSKIIKENFNGF